MPRIETLLHDIDAHLRRAAALQTPARTSLTAAQVQLRWPRYWNFDAVHAALTLRLLEKLHQLRLAVVDGGFGCLTLTIEIEDLPPEDARALAERIFADAQIAKLIEQAGQVRVSRTRTADTQLSDAASALTSADETRVRLCVETAEEALGITPSANTSLPERIRDIEAQAETRHKPSSAKADKAERSAWWLGDIIGGILGGLTKSLGG
ncbi:MAG: hypothetical protein AAF601_02700 [Pseudomonadota bacterium]